MLPLLLLAASVAAGPIVSADWLQAHLNDPQVRVIYVGNGSNDPDYKQGHIPGARLLDHMATFARGGRLAPPEQLAHVFASAGVTDGARVVLYGDSASATGWVYSALVSIGFADDVSWLDGGMGGWRAGNRPLETATPPAGKGPLTVRPAPDWFVDATWVRGHLNSPTTKLLDARSEREWQGGHLPGATLILVQDLFTDAHGLTFKSPEEIRALLARAGVGPNQDVVAYCAMGMRASLMGWAARMAGVKVRVYLGGWADWSKDPANPTVRP